LIISVLSNAYFFISVVDRTADFFFADFFSRKVPRKRISWESPPRGTGGAVAIGSDVIGNSMGNPNGNGAFGGVLDSIITEL
jgi:hypothetical protein